MNKLKDGIRIFLPIILGSMIGYLIKDSIDYNILNQPPLSPSSAAFPIAWSILYLVIGISYCIYRKKYNEKKTIILYYVGLFFNLLWPLLFFMFKLRFISIIWIIILLLLTIKLFINYKRENKISAYLLIPYIIWLIYATYLNIGIVVLN